MSTYIIYNTLNGRIIMEGLGPLDSVDPLVFGDFMAIMAYSDSLSFDLLYVEDDVVKEKTEFQMSVSANQILSNGTDESIISNLPAGVQVEWPDGQTDTVTDGEISFSVDLPGTYTFKFTAVPYLDKEITVEAIAAT